MPDLNFVNFKVGTSTAYASAQKDENTLYFLSDTHQLYKGTVDYSSSVIYAAVKPSAGIEGKLYIIGNKAYTYVADGASWTEVWDLDKKASLDGATFTGSVILKGDPVADNEAATKHYVDSKAAAVDAMRFKGTVSSSSALPTTNVKTGDTYKVAEAGTYAGVVCEIGDMIIAVTDAETAAGNDTWTVIQGNLDGAVTGPTSATSDNIVVFGDATGKVVKDSSKKIGGAEFEGTTSANTIATEAGVEDFVEDAISESETSLKQHVATEISSAKTDLQGYADSAVSTAKSAIESELENYAKSEDLEEYVTSDDLDDAKSELTSSLQDYADNAAEEAAAAVKLVWTSI